MQILITDFALHIGLLAGGRLGVKSDIFVHFCIERQRSKCVGRCVKHGGKSLTISRIGYVPNLGRSGSITDGKAYGASGSIIDGAAECERIACLHSERTSGIELDIIEKTECGGIPIRKTNSNVLSAFGRWRKRLIGTYRFGSFVKLACGNRTDTHDGRVTLHRDGKRRLIRRIGC